MRIGWKVFFTKLALASLACSASAQGLSSIAFEELQPIADRSLQLSRDVESASRGIAIARAGVANAVCYFELSAMSVTEFNSELLRLQTLILISDDMHDPYDVRKVLSQVKNISVQLLKTIEDDRSFVNRVPSDCLDDHLRSGESPGIAEPLHVLDFCFACDRRANLVLAFAAEKKISEIFRAGS